MKVNLKELRLHTGLDQKQLSQKINEISNLKSSGKSIGQSDISKYETNPELLSIELLGIWLEALGTDLQTALLKNSEKIEKKFDLSVKRNPYEKLNANFQNIQKYIDEASDVIKSSTGEPFDLESLSEYVDVLNRKPNIALVGKFDSGKSTLINTLLDARILPTDFAPTTNINIIIRHIDDRPSWLKDDVWVFNESFDPLLLNNRGNLESNKIYSGPYESLQDFAHSSKGKRFDINNANFAMAFIDSEILKLCNLIDAPGYGNSEVDDKKAQSLYDDKDKAVRLQSLMDVVVLTSVYAGFMAAEELMILGTIVQTMPIYFNHKTENPLRNLYILSTHMTEDVLNECPFENFKGKHLKRISRYLAPMLDKNEIQVEKIISDRIFSFNHRKDEISELFYEDIKSLLLKEIAYRKIEVTDKEFSASRQKGQSKVQNELNFIRQMLKDKSLIKVKIIEIRNDEERRLQDVELKTDAICLQINNSKEEHLHFFDDQTENQCDEENLISIIKDKFTDKKDARNNFPGYIANMIQNSVHKESKRLANPLNKLIDELMDSYDSAFKFGDEVKIECDIPFDAKAAFIGGFSGLATVGLLSFWISTLGNLGGYLFTAKIVSILSTIGISVGGTSAAISVVSAMGGPFTFVLVISIAVALVAWRMMLSSWEARLAKKVRKEFISGEANKVFVEHISKGWDDTKFAFKKASDNLEKEFQTKVSEMENYINDFSEDDLKKEECKLKEYLSFLTELPWSM